MPRQGQDFAADLPAALDVRASQPSRGMPRAESSAIGARFGRAETAIEVLLYL